MANRLFGSLVVGLSLGFAACGGESLTLPSEGEPATIAVTGGNTQNGRVGTVLTTPLTVVVTDTKNRPVAGATVEFDFTQGGGQANPASAVTGNDGLASSLLTLGTQVGPVSGVARVPVPAGRAPVQATFTATAVSSDANGIALVSGDNQNGLVGTTLAQPLVVQVTDGFGNPIAGVTVGWSVTGGGSVSAPSTDTDVNGQASVQRTLGGQAGAQTTLASAVGLAGSPVTFSHTATAGSASSVVKISGDVGSAAAGSMVDLMVEVRDASGNPISGAPVNWVVGEGGGLVTPANNTTGSDGRAGAQWTLGSAPGTNTLTAVSGGATATFTIIGTGTGSPSRLGVVTQPSDVMVGAMISPAPMVQIRDANGNDVALAGVEITVAKSSGSGTLQGTQTVTSDGNGRAQFPDLRITGGTGTHRLIFSAEGYSSASSNRFEVNKASTTTAITSDDPDPSDPNQPVTVTFKVDWPSSAGTPTGRVDVAMTDGGGAQCDGPIDATGNGSCVLTNLTTSGLRTLAATYRGDGLFTGSTSPVVTHTVNPVLPPPNPAPVANPDAYTVTAGTTLTVGSPGVLGNDTDDLGDVMAAEVVAFPAGTFRFDAGGSFDYTPVTGAGTTDSFTYQVRDLHGNVSNIATVTITIQ